MIEKTKKDKALRTHLRRVDDRHPDLEDSEGRTPAYCGLWIRTNKIIDEVSGVNCTVCLAKINGVSLRLLKRVERESNRITYDELTKDR